MGAIYDSQATVTTAVTFDDATFTGLTAGNGAAILCKKPGTATLIDSYFGKNYASANGGAISTGVEAALVITGGTFKSNRAQTAGGAINNGSGKLNVSDALFFGNTAATAGAIYANYGTNQISHTEFSKNYAKQYGGAIYSVLVKDATFDYCVFSGNSANKMGGAIEHENGQLHIEFCEFSKNQGRVGGGAISNSGTISIANSSFTGNNSVLGGAIYNTTVLTVTSSYFTKGSGLYGGGIGNISGSTATIFGSTFTYNSVDAEGGALYNEAGSTMYVYDTLLALNSAEGCGGAISNNGTLYLSGVTFCGNSCGIGGALYSEAGGTFYLDNCKFETESDSVSIAAGTIYVSGDILSESSITISGKSELHFANQVAITVDGTLNLSSSTKVSFDYGQQVKFMDAQDFSKNTLSATVDWTMGDSFTLAVGDMTFAAIQTIKVNDMGLVLGTVLSVGGYNYKAEYVTTENDSRLIVKRYTESVNTTKAFADSFKSSTSSICNFDKSLDGQTITKADLGTNNLQATADKSFIGNGSEKTIIGVNMFGNAHNLTLSNLTCTGFVFGGANGTYVDGTTQTVTLQGDISVDRAFAGTRIASVQTGTEVNSTSLILTDDVNGEFDILSGGNLVSASATEFANTSVSVLSEDADVSIGYVITGSLVNKTVDYTVTGETNLTITAGKYDWIIGAGFVQGTGSYNQEGNVNVNITGGTIEVMFGGISCDKADNGSKSITGDINITIDSSKNQIALFSLFAGNNGVNSTIDGNVNVTFTGKGDNLIFTDGKSGSGKNGVVGDSATGMKTVSGTRTFNFDAFTGAFTAKTVKKFDAMNVISGSQVDLSVYDLSAISAWNFDADSSLNWTDGHNNDFSGDTLKFGSAGDELSDAGVAFLSTNDDVLLKGWTDFDTVTLLGQNAAFDQDANCWVSDSYSMSRVDEEGEYKLIVSAKIA